MRKSFWKLPDKAPVIFPPSISPRPSMRSTFRSSMRPTSARPPLDRPNTPRFFFFSFFPPLHPFHLQTLPLPPSIHRVRVSFHYIVYRASFSGSSHIYIYISKRMNVQRFAVTARFAWRIFFQKVFHISGFSHSAQVVSSICTTISLCLHSLFIIYQKSISTIRWVDPLPNFNTRVLTRSAKKF